MRRQIFALFLLVVPGAVFADEVADPVAAINHTLDTLHDAAANADGPRYFVLYASNAIYIGTDAAERWTIDQFKAYAQSYFSKGKGWTYHPRERHVVLTDLPCRCIAWFDELLDSQDYGTSRGTGVVVLEDGAWKVAQYALTFPIPNPLAARMTGEIKAFATKATVVP